MHKFKKIKKEIRIVAWDDGPFEFKSRGKDVVVGVVYRGAQAIDGLLRINVDIDGTDAEPKMIRAMKKMKFKDVRVVMLDGITFAGFNTVNIRNMYKRTGLPVIVINRKEPDFLKFTSALKKLKNAEKRLKAVEDAGPIYRVNNVCFQCCGISAGTAKEIIKTTSTRSYIPEPLRAAHIIATGIVKGESIGRA